MKDLVTGYYRTDRTDSNYIKLYGKYKTHGKSCNYTVSIAQSQFGTFAAKWGHEILIYIS